MAEKLIYCIDMGNTRTHCSSVSYSDAMYKCLSTQEFSTQSFCEDFQKKSLFEKSGASAISWCSVVPKVADEFAKILSIESNIPQMRLSSKNSPIKIDCVNPEQVGQDRIADAVGAGLFFEPPYIIVDMGTAVTIDLVDSNGVYAGGIIAPGMHAFTAYLSERAAQLPLINPADADFDKVIGKNTVEAMLIGCVKGFCKLADGIIEDIEKSYFKNLEGGISQRTVFTGGSVELLPKKWLADRKIESNLAQLGLAKSYILNEHNL